MCVYACIKAILIVSNIPWQIIMSSVIKVYRPSKFGNLPVFTHAKFIDFTKPMKNSSHWTGVELYWLLWMLCHMDIISRSREDAVCRYDFSVQHVCIFRSWYMKWNDLIWWLRNYDAGFLFDLHRKYTKEIFCAQFDVAVKRRMEWIENRTIMCNLHYSLFLYFPHHVYRYLS